MSRRELPMLGPTGRGQSAPHGKVAEEDDPLELVGVPVAVDEATFDEMARCFVEEFVRDGWPDERLLPLFRSPCRQRRLFACAEYCHPSRSPCRA